jgi:hypothetical protein
LAIGVRAYRVLDSVGNIGGGDGGISDDGARRICDGAFNVARGADTLRVNHAGKQQARKNDSEQMDSRPHKPSKMAVAKRWEMVRYSRLTEAKTPANA